MVNNKVFNKITTADKDINQIQQNIENVIKPILKDILLDGIHLKGIKLTVGENTINHKLGRNLQGWIITRQDEFCQFRDIQSSNKTPHLTLILDCTNDVTVDIRVF